MKYSIIIPYRNREEHLQVLLPVLIDKFSDESFEIIVSEQNDTDNFRISCVQNIAYKYAKGDILIFHQVDYVPSDAFIKHLFLLIYMKRTLFTP